MFDRPDFPPPALWCIIAHLVSDERVPLDARCGSSHDAAFADAAAAHRDVAHVAMCSRTLWWQRFALDNDAYVLRRLVPFSRNRNNVHRVLTAAVPQAFVEHAAAHGNAAAHLALGTLLVNADWDRAHAHLLAAVRGGCGSGYAALAWCVSIRGWRSELMCNTHVELFRQGARRGDLESCRWYAWFLDNSDFTDADVEGARRLHVCAYWLCTDADGAQRLSSLMDYANTFETEAQRCLMRLMGLRHLAGVECVSAIAVDVHRQLEAFGIARADIDAVVVQGGNAYLHSLFEQLARRELHNDDERFDACERAFAAALAAGRAMVKRHTARPWWSRCALRDVPVWRPRATFEPGRGRRTASPPPPPGAEPLSASPPSAVRANRPDYHTMLTYMRRLMAALHATRDETRREALALRATTTLLFGIGAVSSDDT